jgi:hypothetical protein
MLVCQNGIKTKKNRFSSIEYYINIFLIITILYNSNSFQSTVDNTLLTIFALIGCLLLAIKNLKMKRTSLKLLIIIIIIPIVSLAANGSVGNIGTTLRFVCISTLALLAAEKYSYIILSNTFITVMLCLVVISIIPYFFINFLGIKKFLLYLPVIYNVNGSSIYNGWLFNIYTYRQDRAMSIFWEPAIFASYCSLAMVFEILFKKRPRFFVLLILTVGIISSKSTGGYLLGLVLLIYFLIKKMTILRFSYLNDIILSSNIIIIGLLVFFLSDIIIKYLNIINPNVFYKLIESNESGSLLTRANSAYYNLKVYFQKPILGWGLGRADGVYTNLGGKNETSTLTYMLAAFGTPGILYTVAWVFGILKQKNIRIPIRIMLLMIIIIILLKEPYQYSCITSCILYSLILNNISQDIIIDKNE